MLLHLLFALTRSYDASLLTHHCDCSVAGLMLRCVKTEKFPDFIHTQKRNPQTNLKDADAFWYIASHTTSSERRVPFIAHVVLCVRYGMIAILRRSCPSRSISSASSSLTAAYRPAIQPHARIQQSHNMESTSMSRLLSISCCMPRTLTHIATRVALVGLLQAIRGSG